MMKNKQVVYQHFRPEEHFFIEKSQDLIDRVENQYSIQVTDFLNPREVEILESLVAQSYLKCYKSNQYHDTEYAKVIIAPEYYEFNMNDFDLALLEFTYNSKFNHISHRQVMGTIMNQLGIQRSIFGDILLTDGCGQIVVDRVMASYFTQSVTKIGKVSIQLKEVDFKTLLPRFVKVHPVEILVASWRIDAIISEILRISRSSVTKLLEKDKVRLNYTSITKVSQELNQGDLLSIRGYGRFVISNQNGLTKSGKYKLTIEKIIEK